MKQKTTILITGGAGYLGSHISYVLAQHGYTIVVLDSFEHNQHFSPQWARVYHGDYGDTHILKKIFKEQVIDMVLHCASSVRSQLSLQRPLECYYNNVANRKPPVITISASCANAGFVNYWNVPIWASDCTTIVEKPNSPASINYIHKY